MVILESVAYLGISGLLAGS